VRRMPLARDELMPDYLSSSLRRASRLGNSEGASEPTMLLLNIAQPAESLTAIVTQRVCRVNGPTLTIRRMKGTGPRPTVLLAGSGSGPGVVPICPFDAIPPPKRSRFLIHVPVRLGREMPQDGRAAFRRADEAACAGRVGLGRSELYVLAFPGLPGS
jgi:hypothetical protein